MFDGTITGTKSIRKKTKKMNLLMVCSRIECNISEWIMLKNPKRPDSSEKKIKKSKFLSFEIFLKYVYCISL